MDFVARISGPSDSTSEPTTIVAAAPSPKSSAEIKCAIERSSRCSVSEHSSIDSNAAA